jgi:ketosteroid isomerase-like protein/ribosomal protein L37E
MDHEKRPGPLRNPPASGREGELAHNPDVDDFFRRLKQDLHHPKPGTEAIASALQAVQRMASHTDSDDSVGAIAEAAESRTCMACGNQNPVENRFCAICGVPQEAAPREATAQATTVPTRTAKAAAPAAGQHHYHHHYHHHYFASSEGGVPLAAPESRPANTAPIARDSRAFAQTGAVGLSRAEAAVRKLTIDWAQACNTKQLDDLVDLYGTDAMLLRPNVPLVRGTAAIREFFFGALDSGLGEVELEPLRVEILGDTAYEAGRCKMLVPSMGKRREERGKYLLTLGRQVGEWKILADCWSSDLILGVSADSSPAKPTPPPATSSLKLPR